TSPPSPAFSLTFTSSINIPIRHSSINMGFLTYIAIVDLFFYQPSIAFELHLYAISKMFQYLQEDHESTKSSPAYHRHHRFLNSLYIIPFLYHFAESPRRLVHLFVKAVGQWIGCVRKCDRV